MDVLFFFKQKTAYEMRISDWSSDVCSSDLLSRLPEWTRDTHERLFGAHLEQVDDVARHQADVASITARFDRLQVGAGRVSTQRSEERRVGKECVSTCRSRW